jgi:hypothetical protein
MNSGAVWGIATQVLPLKTGGAATFSIDTGDASLVHLQIDADDGSGTLYTFNHNGDMRDTADIPAPSAPLSTKTTTASTSTSKSKG